MTQSRSPLVNVGVRQRLVDAALSLFREKGYASTSVEALCVRAGVTKGGFFHHFECKDALAVAAANYWSQTTGELFESAPYHLPDDPFDRLMAYLEFRKALLRGSAAEYTCLAGTMLQEVYGTHKDIRDACAASISGHAATLEADISEAVQRYGIQASWTPRSLALHMQAVLQGAFILAKAQGSAVIAAESIDHLSCYFELLFNVQTNRQEMS